MENDSTITFYAVCDVNGPISVRIEAASVEDAVARWATMDARERIDSASTDAEDDLDIAGEGMDEDAFAAALEAAGCTRVRDLDAVHNAHAGTTAHLAGGWYLWQAPMESEPASDFVPTHEIHLTDTRDGSRTRVEVQLVDGAAYTRAEWESETAADWECDANGTWSFQGRATPAPHLEVEVRPVPGLDEENDARLDAALEGIDVIAAGGVVRVRDGHDTWLCREAEWDAMVERVRSGAVRLTGDDDYTTICGAVRGPTLSLNGSDRGTIEERRELLRAAVEAELLLETDAARYGLPPLFAIGTGAPAGDLVEELAEMGVEARIPDAGEAALADLIEELGDVVLVDITEAEAVRLAGELGGVWRPVMALKSRG